VPTFETLCLFYLHRRVGTKYDWGCECGVFIQEKVWLEKQPQPLGRRVTGWEQVEKQVVEAMTHMEARGKCVRE